MGMSEVGGCGVGSPLRGRGGGLGAGLVGGGFTGGGLGWWFGWEGLEGAIAGCVFCGWILR